jgi:hypothetical protein
VNLKKRVKWPVLKLFERNLRKILRSSKHMMSDLMGKEKLRGAEFE